MEIAVLSIVATGMKFMGSEDNTTTFEPVEWMTLTIMGSLWPVVVTTREHHPEIEDLEGYADYHKCRILLAAHLTPARREDVLVHETLHAIIFMIGFDKLLEVLLKTLTLSTVTADDREELLISHLAPVLTDTLKRNNLLTFPPFPGVEKKTARKRGGRSRR